MLKNPFHIGIIIDNLIAERISRKEAVDRIWELISDDRSEIAADLDKIILILTRE